ncbi:S1 family peptidase [Streptomyces sp. SAI-041]|uniref:S1 family peptidase n=1 Tax=Streptomyces sp. SAI-041 TaxID=2940548 RepID=UPI0032AF63BB
MTSIKSSSPRSAVGAALVAVVATAGALLSVPAHAVVGGPVATGSYAFTARVSLGADDTARACSGALVASNWILTAASCFAADVEVPTVAAGKPALSATATVAGKTSAVVQLVPRAGRDLVLARLARPVTGVTPVTVATTAPAAGDQLRAVGYGRTASDWLTATAHSTAFAVDAVGADDLTITGQNGALCQGDTGAPLLRETNGTAELVGVGSRSWQGGCLGETETRHRGDRRPLRRPGLLGLRHDGPRAGHRLQLRRRRGHRGLRPQGHRRRELRCRSGPRRVRRRQGHRRDQPVPHLGLRLRRGERRLR